MWERCRKNWQRWVLENCFKTSSPLCYNQNGGRRPDAWKPGLISGQHSVDTCNWSHESLLQTLMNGNWMEAPHTVAPRLQHSVQHQKHIIRTQYTNPASCMELLFETLKCSNWWREIRIILMTLSMVTRNQLWRHQGEASNAAHQYWPEISPMGLIIWETWRLRGEPGGFIINYKGSHAIRSVNFTAPTNNYMLKRRHTNAHQPTHAVALVFPFSMTRIQVKIINLKYNKIERAVLQTPTAQ